MMKLRAFLASAALVVPAVAPAQDIVIGQVAQLGPTQVGAQLRRGAEICFEAVNRTGGVHGRKLRLVARPRDANPADALVKTRALLSQEKPVALLNLMGTSYMEALVREKVLEEEKMPVVGIRTGAVSLHRPVNPWLFHTRASYAAEVDKVLRYFATIGVKRVALVHESSPFGKEVQGHLDALLAGTGLQLATRATIDAQATVASPAVEPVVKVQPEAVIIAASSFATADFYKAVRQKGLTAHVVALSTADGGQVVQRIGAEAAHGLGVVQVVPNPAVRTTRIAREFQDALSGINAPAQDLNQGALEGYLAAKVLVEGLRRAGPEPTGARVRAALEGIRHLDLGEYAVSFSASNHSGSQFVDIAILSRGGKMLR